MNDGQAGTKACMNCCWHGAVDGGAAIILGGVGKKCCTPATPPSMRGMSTEFLAFFHCNEFQLHCMPLPEKKQRLEPTSYPAASARICTRTPNEMRRGYFLAQDLESGMLVGVAVRSGRTRPGLGAGCRMLLRGFNKMELTVMVLPSWLWAYFPNVGPETMLSVTSVLAAIIGVLLIFWHYVLNMGKRVLQLFAGKPNQGSGVRRHRTEAEVIEKQSASTEPSLLTSDS